MTPTGHVPRLSFTKLALFEFCPAAYRYRYVDRVRVPFASRLVIGAIVHSVLHRLFQRLLAREPVDKAIVDRLHADYWVKAPQLNRGRNLDIWTAAQALLDRYWAANHESLGTPIMLESRFRFRPESAENYSIEGIVDRVDVNSSGTEIIDYKTGHRPPNMPDRLRAQLHTYALGVERTVERTADRLTAYFLADNETISVKPDPEYKAELLGRYTAVAAGVEDGNYQARPGPHCHHCDFNRGCAFRWRAD